MPFQPAFDPPDIGPGCVDLLKHKYVVAWDIETCRAPIVERMSQGKKKEIWRNKVLRYVSSTMSSRDAMPSVIRDLERHGHARVRKGRDAWSALFDRKGSMESTLWLCDPSTDAVVVGQNLPFDFVGAAHALRHEPSFLTNVFRLYAENRVADVMIRDKLIAIAEGWMGRKDPRTGQEYKFQLSDIVKRRFGVEMEGKKGDDIWRTRFHELEGVPLDRWPDAAVDYSFGDAEWPLWTAFNQAPLNSPSLSDELDPITTPNGGVIDESRQCRKAWALHLRSVWGVRTDPARVKAWGEEIDRALEGATAGITRLGVLRTEESIRAEKAKYARGEKKPSFGKAGSKDSKILAELVRRDYERQGLEVPRTKTGQVSTAGDVLLGCQTRELREWGEAASYEKYRSTYLQSARLGVVNPVPYSYDPLKETGRSSSYGDNLQNPPRKGAYRSCIVPRKGNVFCSVDFDAAELCGLGQIHYWLFGTSVLRDTINAGIDAHAPMAAMLAGVTLDEMLLWLTPGHPRYKEAKDLYRQVAKACNFGLPGGLGAPSLVTYAEGMGVNLFQIAVATKWHESEEGQRTWRWYEPRENGEDGYTPVSAELTPELWADAVNRKDPKAMRLISICYACHIRETWQRTIKEAVPYMALIKQAVKETHGNFTFKQFVSNRQRGGCGFGDGCNTGFQALVIDGAGPAIFRTTVACYLPPEDAAAILLSPTNDQDVTRWEELSHAEVIKACEALYGVRPVLFIHDEDIAEGPKETAHVWGPYMAAMMRDGMRVVIRDVTVSAKPALTDCWIKGAEPVYDSEGRLTLYKPSR